MFYICKANFIISTLCMPKLVQISSKDTVTTQEDTGNTRTMCEICLKITNIPERRCCCRLVSALLTLNIFHTIFLVFLLVNLRMYLFVTSYLFFRIIWYCLFNGTHLAQTLVEIMTNFWTGKIFQFKESIRGSEG